MPSFPLLDYLPNRPFQPVFHPLANTGQSQSFPKILETVNGAPAFGKDSFAQNLDANGTYGSGYNNREHCHGKDLCV